MTPAERAERTRRLKAQRVAEGKAETIQSPGFYSLLAACLSTAQENTPRTS